MCERLPICAHFRGQSGSATNAGFDRAQLLCMLARLLHDGDIHSRDTGQLRWVVTTNGLYYLFDLELRQEHHRSGSQNREVHTNRHSVGMKEWRDTQRNFLSVTRLDAPTTRLQRVCQEIAMCQHSAFRKSSCASR